MAIDVGELRGIITLKDQFSGPARAATKEVGGFSNALGLAAKGAGIAAGAFVAAGAAIVMLGRRGAVVDDVSSAFNKLQGGAEGARATLDQMTAGVAGTVSKFNLMATANAVAGAGIKTTAEDMGTLTAGARVLAKATGGDTKEALDQLTRSLTTGRTSALKQMGVFVDTKVAVENYAAAIGVSSSNLSDQERAQAVATAALAALKTRISEAGVGARDFGEIIDAGRVHLGNFVDGLSVAVATSPVVTAGMSAMEEALENAFGGDQEALIGRLQGAVNSFALGVVQGAQAGAEGARFMVNAWHGLDAGFNAIFEAITSGLGKFIGSLSNVVYAAGALPGVGEKLDGLAANLTAMGGDLEHLSGGFAAQATAALDSAAVSNAAFDSVAATLKNVETSMRAASGAQTQLASTATAAAAAEGQLGAASDAAAMRSQLAADSFKAAQEKKRQAIEQAGASIIAKTLQLEQELALAQTEGIEKRLLEIAFAHQKELAGLVEFKGMAGGIYESLAALVNEKYKGMAEAATNAHGSIEAAAAAQGFQTRAQLEETAAKAIETYQRMRESGKFNAAELQRAWELAEDAKRRSTDETQRHTLSSGEAIVQGTMQLFGQLGQKFKAAAIAGAIIATYQAIAKALAAAPWPANLVLAAGAAAAGWENVNRIRSSDPGWKEGTPGTRFVDFGRESTQLLHGPEAVVTPEQGESLAGMVGREMLKARAQGNEEMRGELVAIRAELRSTRNLMPVWIKGAVQQARAR